MTKYSVVRVGKEFAVAADNRHVIKFGSVELAGELVQALTGQDTSRPQPAANRYENYQFVECKLPT